MEETYTTKAIVLNRQPFRESDSRTVVYTCDRGKLELVVRGARKLESKLAGHLEPFNLSKIMVVRGRNFDYIGGAVNIDCYINIKNDLEKLSCAGKVVGLVNKIVKENEKDGGVFSLLSEFLKIVDCQLSIVNYELFYHFFVLKLLAELGYKPELYSCVACQKKLKPGSNLFDLLKGGVVCANCQTAGDKNQLTISDDCVKVLRLALKEDFVKLTNLKIEKNLAKEINKIIDNFFNYNLN